MPSNPFQTKKTVEVADVTKQMPPDTDLTAGAVTGAAPETNDATVEPTVETHESLLNKLLGELESAVAMGKSEIVAVIDKFKAEADKL